MALRVQAQLLPIHRRWILSGISAVHQMLLKAFQYRELKL